MKYIVIDCQSISLEARDYNLLLKAHTAGALCSFILQEATGHISILDPGACFSKVLRAFRARKAICQTTIYLF